MRVHPPVCSQAVPARGGASVHASRPENAQHPAGLVQRERAGHLQNIGFRCVQRALRARKRRFSSEKGVVWGGWKEQTLLMLLKRVKRMVLVEFLLTINTVGLSKRLYVDSLKEETHTRAVVNPTVNDSINVFFTLLSYFTPIE